MLNWILIIMFYSVHDSGLVTSIRVNSQASCQNVAKEMKIFNRRFDYICLEDK